MEMSNEIGSRVRYGEAFWRAHHEAWQQSALNQREYCEAQGIPLKAFGNWRARFKAEPQWRARFKAEPQPPVRKLLYRRRGLSHSVSHSLSHMTYGGADPIVLPAREGHRRKFSEADKSRIVEEAVQPGASLSEVALGCGRGRTVAGSLNTSGHPLLQTRSRRHLPPAVALSIIRFRA
jgi:hypothetical protein